MKKTRQIKIGALSYALMLANMIDGDNSCLELSEITGLHYVTVLRYTREIHLAGACHITRYEKDSRNRDAIRVYKLGRGKDAKRGSMSDSARALKYRARKNAASLNHMMAGAMA